MEVGDEKIVDMIKIKCFMDDINVDGKYEENLQVNIKQVEKILANGGFTFKKWVRNGDIGEKQLAESETGINKSLGMSWKTKADKLVDRLKLFLYTFIKDLRYYFNNYYRIIYGYVNY